MYKRNTIQRTLILETVRKLRNHPTADEVYSELIKQHPTISRATIYRGLHELNEAGKIKVREIPDSVARYDHLCTDHYHVRCKVCGKVSDVDMDYLPDLQKNIKDSHGYLFTGHDIVFRGICSDCSKKL